MKSRNIILIVILLVVVLFGGCACTGYNNLVRQDQAVKTSWGNVQTEYQRRADLVPNLVNTVKGAANFEQSTLTQVIQARSRATSVNINAADLTPERIQQFQAAQAQLSGALSRLIAVAEAYPDLKANQNFLQLQGQLEGIENGIRTSRNSFNGAVNDYNITVRSFPASLYAGLFGFRQRAAFEADPGADRAPKVQF